MIIKGLMLLIKNILSLLFVFNLPALPDSVHETMTSMVSYLGDGISILRAFIGSEALSVLATLLSAIILLESAYLVYTGITWILKKIPMLGIQ